MSFWSLERCDIGCDVICGVVVEFRHVEERSALVSEAVLRVVSAITLLAGRGAMCGMATKGPAPLDFNRSMVTPSSVEIVNP